MTLRPSGRSVAPTIFSPAGAVNRAEHKRSRQMAAHYRLPAAVSGEDVALARQGCSTQSAGRCGQVRRWLVLGVDDNRVCAGHALESADGFRRLPTAQCRHFPPLETFEKSCSSQTAPAR
jgi:hypothetical protein